MGRRERGGRRARPAAAVQGFIWNAGAFAIAVWQLHLPDVAVAFWGLGLAMHGATLVPVLARWSRARRGAAEPAAGSTGGAHPAAAGLAPDPYLAELDRKLAALEAAAHGRPFPPGLDLAALRREAEALRGRHLALAEVAAPAERERLAAERADALGRADASADPRTSEVLRAQARSVGERLAALDEATAAATRLEARERTLLHQLEALRLSLVQAGTDEGRAPDLAAEVRSIQLDVKATAELESDLARARGAARRQST